MCFICDILNKYWTTIFTIFPIGISIVALSISILSFVRSSRYQSYDYSERLQILNECISQSSPSFTNAFSYSAKIENRGLKPVEIDNVWIDYGSQDEIKKRLKHNITGRFYLSPSQAKEITFQLDRKDMKETMERFNINKCIFFLRVEYKTVYGKITCAVRLIGGYEGNSCIFFAQRGDPLT